jgi:hypothetical protein
LETIHLTPNTMSVHIDELYWSAKIDYNGLRSDINKIEADIAGMSKRTAQHAK